MMRRAVLRQLSLRSGTPLRPSPSPLTRFPPSPRAQEEAAAVRRSGLGVLQQSQSWRGYADSAADKPAAEEASKSPEGAPAEGGASAAAEGQTLKTELEKKDAEIRDLKDKYLRSVADFRNLQERSKREQASARDFAITRFAKDLVESIDNLDRALGAAPAEAVAQEGDLKNLYDGLRMTESVLMNTLARHGLERFDPSQEAEGGGAQRFDPNRHEAAFMTKMEDKEDGTVFATMQKGFLLNGRIIRAAKVGVVKNS